MRRLFVGVLAVSLVFSAHAQWTNVPDPTLAGRGGIGGPTHPTVRLRITENQGVLTNGPFFLSFGSATSLWWAYRLDTGNNLHLDRDSDTGWAEGWVFKRDGNFGISVDPQHLIHAVKDQNSGSVLRLVDGSAGNAAFTATQFAEGATLKAEVKSVNSGFTTAQGGANAFHLWNYANSPTIFATNGQERMRISADGTIGINYNGTFPARLMVQHGTDDSTALYVSHQPAVEANINQNDRGVIIQATETVQPGVTNSGSLYGLHSWTRMTGPGTLDRIFGSFVETGPTAGGTVNASYGLYVNSITSAGSTVGNGYGAFITDVLATNDYAFYQVSPTDTNYFAGNVIIGTPTPIAVPANNVLYVKGESFFDGTVTGTNIKAHYQDVAEWVPSTTDLAPGSVVILNRERNNEVMASFSAYDTSVAGVVSAQPGISLGIEGEGKEQIATTGRVKVRVDARATPVRIGDLLVTSDLPGTAMRSEPMDINGRKFHQPGTIIGKALEPLDGGVGEILVLLSLQ
jgi:hypothetical protein